MNPTVTAIAAIGKHRALGKENKLLWHIPDDLRRFKELTLGHPLILGRKTFDSIIGYNDGKPLPGRQHIVVTRDPSWSCAGVIPAASVEDAIAKGKEIDRHMVCIGGGAQI
ncbi:MAG: dihydrofolate reductase, partial [Candidatus Paceibacterota bacterium]